MMQHLTSYLPVTAETGEAPKIVFMAIFLNVDTVLVMYVGSQCQL